MASKKHIPMLLDEPCLMVYPSLAVELGINKAIVFQQLHFLLNGQKTARNMYNFIDSAWWVYNSYNQWKERYFPWLSLSTLKNIFLELEKDGLIKTRQGVRSKSDRRKWYTIDYETWSYTIGQKLSHDETKIVRSNGQKLSDDISENTKEDIKEEKDSTAPVKPDAVKEPPTTIPEEDRYLLGHSPMERLDVLRNESKLVKEPDERRNYKGYTKSPFYKQVERIFCYGCAVKSRRFKGYVLGQQCKWFHNEATGRDGQPATLTDLLDMMAWYLRETNGYDFPRGENFQNWWQQWKDKNPTITQLLQEQPVHVPVSQQYIEDYNKAVEQSKKGAA